MWIHIFFPFKLNKLLWILKVTHAIIHERDLPRDDCVIVRRKVNNAQGINTCVFARTPPQSNNLPDVCDQIENQSLVSAQLR